MNKSNPTETLSDASAKAQRYGEHVMSDVKNIATYSLLALLVGLIFASLMAGFWAGSGILAMVALACYVIGSGLGFLFSIPKSAQNSEGVQKISGSNSTSIPRDNTNLEQISDWLVKILIGASLVQIGTIKSLFEHLAEKLSHCLLSAKAQAFGILPPTGLTDVYCQPFCLFLILYFLALGFLTGYLITRLWLPYTILLSGLAMQSTQNEADEVAKIRQDVSDQEEKLTLLNEAIPVLNLAINTEKTSPDFSSISRLAFRKAEECRKELPTNRLIGILLGRLERKVNGYVAAIAVLDGFILEWIQAKKPINFDFAAFLFNRACYKNRRAEELELSGDKESAEKIRDSAWDDLKKSCEHDTENKSELSDDDLKSLFNSTTRKRDSL
jgi:hypothetical protein